MGNFSAAAMTTRDSASVLGSVIRLMSRTPKSVSIALGVALAAKKAHIRSADWRVFGADDRLEQLVLGVEIGVERALGDAGGARDVVHARAVEAGAQENLARAVHDLAPFGAAVVSAADFLFQSFQFHGPYVLPGRADPSLTERFGSIFVAIALAFALSQQK